MAANIWRPAGVNNNWNNSLNWSLLAVPTANDGNVATFDANALSGPCTVNVASVCNTIDLSAYNNTITMTNTLTVSGNITLGSGMTFAGASALIADTTGTWTSNGKTMNNPLSVIKSPGGTITITLADNWIVTGVFTLNNNGTSTTFNGNQFTFRGNYIGTTSFAGTTNILFDGTTVVSNSSTIGSNLTINTSGTITFGSIFSFNGTKTFTYTAGSVVVPSTLNISSLGATTSLDVSGLTFVNVTTSAAGTNITTLLSNLNMSGNLTIQGATTINGSGKNINLGGNLTQTAGTGNFQGTANIVVTGNCTWSNSNANFDVRLNLEFNAPSSTLTLSGANLRYSTNTLKFTALGNIINTNSTLTSSGTMTINMSGVNFNNLINNTNTTFNGTNGWTSLNYTCTAAGSTITWKNGNTYIITNTITLTGTAASNITFISASAGNRYNFIVNYGATLNDVGFINSTDANSANGLTIWNYKGTISNTNNWNAPSTAFLKTISTTY